MSITDSLNEASTAALFGYGRSNQAVHRFLRERYPTLRVTLRSDVDVDLSSDVLSAFSDVRTRERARTEINEDVIFLSPTVRRDSQELREASERGTLLSSDLELFFDVYKGDCIGITGSDGKSSTACLCASMMTGEERRALPLGNFGKSPLDILNSGVYPVIELSSFQLMNFAPKLKRACITNITRNHLNWHRDFKEYTDSKLNALINAEGSVYDYDSEHLRGAMQGRHSFAACSSRLSHRELICRCDTLHTLTLDREMIKLDGEAYFSVTSAMRKESYNLKNYLLATATTLSLTDRKNQKSAVNRFPGLTHRCELIEIIGGIKFYNSSIDTSPKRTISTLSNFQGDVTLILTGRPKSLEIDELTRVIRERGITVVAFGECESAYASALSTVKVIRANDMEDAVYQALKITKPCASVLLSPSATGYDLYKSFEERGEDFRRCVKKYKEREIQKRKPIQ